MDNQLPDFESVQAVCTSAPEPFDVAGVYGFISASLAVDGSITLSRCLREYGDGEITSAFLSAHPQLAQDFAQIYGSIHFALTETEFEYQLFLPDEDASMADRLKAVAHFCDDFFLGFGIAQSRSNVPVSSEMREILNQFSECSLVEWHDAEQDEQSEMDYVDLVEFIRMGVIFIHSEFGVAT